MAKKRKHAMQPVVWDGRGVIRFQENPIVSFLLDKGGFDLNQLTRMSDEQGWTLEDWSHFAQLHGYSVSGWGDLSYCTNQQWETAESRCDKLRVEHPVDPNMPVKEA